MTADIPRATFRNARNEAIGVHVAESLPRGGIDLIEYAVRSSSMEMCAAHFGVSFTSLLVGGVFAVTAEPPLSVKT